MAEPAKTSAVSYDEFPYTGYAYWFTHPDQLGIIGGLHGIATALASKCRVLEIACGDGANLLSLGTLLPGSRFVGIDLSDVHIGAGREMAARLGITNVDLRHADIMTFEVEPGGFDYVIAHGIYSWCPPPVRDGLLALVKRALAPSGVALVSYNTLPGAYIFEPVRELMRLHTSVLDDPKQMVRQAHSIAATWCHYLEGTDPDDRGAIATRIAEVLKGYSSTLMRHDLLSENSDPSWFSDFVAHAGRHGLAYLDNAVPSAQRLALLEREAQEMLMPIDDPIRVQQYIDHFAETRFRTTLIVHADAPRTTPLSFRELSLEDRLHTAPDAADTMGPKPRVFLETPGGTLEITDSPTRVALAILVEEVPNAMPVPELVDRMIPRLLAFADEGAEPFVPTAESREELIDRVEAVFADLWRRDVVFFWREPPPRVVAGDRPATGAMQRLFAERLRYIPSLYHRTTELVGKEREVIQALDGTLDMPALIDRFGPEAPAVVLALRRKRFLQS